MAYQAAHNVVLSTLLHCLQDNLGSIGWELSNEHYEALSTLPYQAKYFTGQGMGYSEKGPWYTFEDLWNEPKPKTDP